MTVQAIAAFNAQTLPASATTFYTVPATPAAIILSGGRMRFTNTDTASHAATAYAIASGGTAGATNCFLNGESIAPNTHMDVDMPVLGAGGFYQALADTASKITITQLGGVLIS